MLCINYDLTLSYLIKEEVIGFLPEFSHGELPSKYDIPNQDVMTIIDELIHNIIRNRDVGNLKRKDNIDLIRFMDEKGVFLVKGAIDKVAESLGLSKVTIYSYLDEARGKD
ncbi:helix-turn-helix domain-containing protein [Clostridium thailandense]|uniref:helix-turn-helix domain-containing protein n=1 Tax=Clostridium thailandense TaxID=2794346 RepID=UPI00398996DB